MKFWVSLVGLVALSGCSAPKAPILAEAPTKQGIFLISAQTAQQPTVVVTNDSDTPLRLILNRSDGQVFTLDVSPRSEGKIDVPTGHYEAKVFDVNGRVRSAYGDADITEYKRYSTDFEVNNNAHGKFHIGD